MIVATRTRGMQGMGDWFGRAAKTAAYALMSSSDRQMIEKFMVEMPAQARHLNNIAAALDAAEGKVNPDALSRARNIHADLSGTFAYINDATKKAAQDAKNDGWEITIGPGWNVTRGLSTPSTEPQGDPGMVGLGLAPLVAGVIIVAIAAAGIVSMYLGNQTIAAIKAYNLQRPVIDAMLAGGDFKGAAGAVFDDGFLDNLGKALGTTGGVVVGVGVLGGLGVLAYYLSKKGKRRR